MDLDRTGQEREKAGQNRTDEKEVGGIEESLFFESFLLNPLSFSSLPYSRITLLN